MISNGIIAYIDESEATWGMLSRFLRCLPLWRARHWLFSLRLPALGRGGPFKNRLAVLVAKCIEMY